MLYHLLNLLNPQNLPYAYTDIMFRAICAVLLGFALVASLMPATVRFLIRRKLGDQPEFNHEALNKLMGDKANIPTMGGVLIVFTVLVCALLLCDLTNYYVWPAAILCVVWLGVLGAMDDWLKLTAGRRSGTRDGIRMWEKLVFQVGLGVLMGYFVYQHGSHNLAVLGQLGDDREAYRVLVVPFYKQGLTLTRGVFMLIAILVITGTSNAVNLTDGMDGLAAGCMVLCSFFFMILTFIVGDQEWATALLLPHVPQSGELSILCGAVLGACLGFLWHNCYPAKVFMGDAGSLPLGGLMGYIAIVTRQELMLFIVGGVFVIEAASVMMQVGYFKLSGGKRIFKVAPIHHHFHLSGWSEPQTVIRFWLMAAVFAALALLTLKLR